MPSRRMASICFPSFASSSRSLVTKDQPEVCALSGRGISACAAPVRPVTGRHSLSPASFTRPVIGLPCGRLCHRSGGGTGLPCSVSSTRRVRSRLFPGGACVRVPPYEREATRPLTFWFRPSSILGLFLLTRFIVDSLTLTFAIKPGPRSASMLADPDDPSRVHPDSIVGVRCSGSFTPRSYPRRMCR